MGRGVPRRYRQHCTSVVVNEVATFDVVDMKVDNKFTLRYSDFCFLAKKPIVGHRQCGEARSG